MTTMITGVTGTIGSQVTTALLERGVENVRVATRRPDAAARWNDRGATVVALDLLDVGSLAKAFSGVERLFLVGPQPQHFGARVGDVIHAAKEAGVAHVVRLSAVGASSDAPFMLGREHFAAERFLRESGMAFTVLQPTFFQDNFVNFHRDAIRTHGAFYGSSAEGRTSFVSSRDIGRAAAKILCSPSEHASETYVLTGPEAHSAAEVATMFSDVVGREVRYVDVSPDQMRASMVDQGTPTWLADGLVELEGIKREGHASAVSPHLVALLDDAPETLRQFIERHREKFA